MTRGGGAGGSPRERLIEGASELFYHRSYGAVGVEEVCRRAKVKKGSFYHFFGSKRELALAVIEAQWNAFSREILTPALTTNRPVNERISQVFTRMAGKQARDRTSRGVPGCPFGNLAADVLRQLAPYTASLLAPPLEAAAIPASGADRSTGPKPTGKSK